jgi:ketosteroid isomerase-like protein
MSEESTTPDPLRRVAEALTRRDLDAAVAIFAADAVFDTTAAGGLGGVYEGRQAIRGFVEAWIAPFADYEQVAEEFRDLGNGVTLSVHLARGRPIGSGGLVELRVGLVATEADGLIERLANYSDLDQARAAAKRLAEESE